MTDNTLPLVSEEPFSPEQLEILDELITERLAEVVRWSQVDIMGTMRFLAERPVPISTIQEGTVEV